MSQSVSDRHRACLKANSKGMSLRRDTALEALWDLSVCVCRHVADVGLF